MAALRVMSRKGDDEIGERATGFGRNRKVVTGAIRCRRCGLGELTGIGIADEERRPLRSLCRPDTSTQGLALEVGSASTAAELVGMVSQRDLLQIDLSEKDEEIRWLNAYIHYIPPVREGTS